MAVFGPSEVHSADEWHCPSCNWTGVFGFNLMPYLRHSDPDFAKKLKQIEESDQVVLRFWLNENEKNANS
jgi:hypothetical protein